MLNFINTAYATSSIALPSGFGGDILAQATATLEGLNSYTVTILGVVIGVVIIEVIIGAIRK